MFVVEGYQLICCEVFGSTGLWYLFNILLSHLHSHIHTSNKSETCAQPVQGWPQIPQNRAELQVAHPGRTVEPETVSNTYPKPSETRSGLWLQPSRDAFKGDDPRTADGFQLYPQNPENPRQSAEMSDCVMATFENRVVFVDAGNGG